VVSCCRWARFFLIRWKWARVTLSFRALKQKCYAKKRYSNYKEAKSVNLGWGHGSSDLYSICLASGDSECGQQKAVPAGTWEGQKFSEGHSGPLCSLRDFLCSENKLGSLIQVSPHSKPLILIEQLPTIHRYHTTNALTCDKEAPYDPDKPTFFFGQYWGLNSGPHAC
jgi:hypothetical protein